MSDPRPTARSIAHRFCETECDNFDDSDVSEHGVVCDRLTAAIEARDAASDAREDRLREALEEIRNDWRPHARRESACDPFTVANEALAAIPPRSDR